MKLRFAAPAAMNSKRMNSEQWMIRDVKFKLKMPRSWRLFVSVKGSLSVRKMWHNAVTDCGPNMNLRCYRLDRLLLHGNVIILRGKPRKLPFSKAELSTRIVCHLFSNKSQSTELIILTHNTICFDPSFDATEYVELENKQPTRTPAAEIATLSARLETSGVSVRRLGTTVPQITVRQKKRPSTELNIARHLSATTAIIQVKIGTLKHVWLSGNY